MKPARKAAARSYTIVINVIPAKDCVTIRRRGKTTTLLSPEMGWDEAPPKQYLDAPNLAQDRFLKFYIRGRKGQMPRTK